MKTLLAFWILMAAQGLSSDDEFLSMDEVVRRAAGEIGTPIIANEPMMECLQRAPKAMIAPGTLRGRAALSACGELLHERGFVLVSTNRGAEGMEYKVCVLDVCGRRVSERPWERKREVGSPVQEGVSENVTKSMEEVLQIVTRESGAEFVAVPELGLATKKVSFPPSLLQGKGALAGRMTLCKQSNLALVRQGSKEGREVWSVLFKDMAFRHNVPSYSSVEELPVNDEFCTLVLKLKNAGAGEIHRAIVQLASNPMGVYPVEGAGIIQMTDYVSNLRRLAGIVRRIDEGTLPSVRRGEYLLTFTLVRAEGEAGAKAGEIPKSLSPFSEILQKEAPFVRYEFMDAAVSRVNLGGIPFGVPGGRKEPVKVLVSLAGQEGFQIQFIPDPASDGSARLDLELRLKGGPVLSTSVTLRSGERGLVGTCRPGSYAWPLILLAELKPVE